MEKGKPERETKNRSFSLWETLTNLWGLIKLRLGFGAPSSEYKEFKDVLEPAAGVKKGPGPQLYYPEQNVQPPLPPLPPERTPVAPERKDKTVAAPLKDKPVAPPRKDAPVAASRNDKPVPPPRAAESLAANVSEALKQQSNLSEDQPPAEEAPKPPKKGPGRARQGKENSKVAPNAELLSQRSKKPLPPDPKPKSGQPTANLNAKVEGLLNQKTQANTELSGGPNKELLPNPHRKLKP